MDKSDIIQELKHNFLDFWKTLSEDETQALIDLKPIPSLERKVIKYAKEYIPFDKVLICFHSYICIAYLSAELIVNAKIFLDTKQQKFILLARKKVDDGTFTIVYSNESELSKFPTVGITADNLLSCLEEDSAKEFLLQYYANHPK